MRSKTTILIIIALSAIVTLSVIEYYLVETTYNYKVQEFREEIKKEMGSIIGDFTRVDSLISYMDTIHSDLRIRYFNNKIDSITILKELTTNKLQEVITPYLDSTINKKFQNLNMKFGQTIDQLIYFNPENQAADTIINTRPSVIENKIYGTLNSLENTFKARSNTGKVSGNGLREHFTQYSFYVSIRNWELIVLRKMLLILILAISSILVVIVIFIHTIRSLIRQKKLNDIQTDFINNITHEFKTPLATLSLATATLKKQGKEEKATYEKTLNSIERQNNRLQKLLDQIMANSIVGKGVSLNKEHITINTYFNNLIDDFKLSVSDKKVTIDYNTPSHSNSTIYIDKFHFSTAVLNILENSVKYGNNDVHISIETKELNQKFEILISDNGPGIAKEKQKFVFDKFFRATDGDTHDVKGLGLGLYYTKLIIEAHNGTINLSNNENVGTAFRITINNP